MNENYITEETLEAFGVKLPNQDTETLLDHLNETLQERVGTEITTSLGDEKLKQLLNLQETAGDEQVGEWLSQNVPELSEIVEDEISILMGEIVENTDAINKS